VNRARQRTEVCKEMDLSDGECMMNNFENCTGFMARQNSELEEPTSCDESVGLARCYFRMAAENLGMQKNYNT